MTIHFPGRVSPSPGVGARRAAILLVVAALGAACSDAPATLRIDVRAYLAHAREWAPTEAETNHTIARILKTQFVDEAEVLREVSGSRPRILTHLRRVQAYSPRSAAVQRIHARYVAGWKELLEGYGAIEEGFASADYTKVARGREAMEDWRAMIERNAQDLRQLVEHFGIDSTGTIESRLPRPTAES